MSKLTKYLLLLILFGGCLSLFSGTLGVSESYSLLEQAELQQPADSTSSRFPVKKTQITTYEDISVKKPIDLRDPSNVKTDVVYDYKTNTYIFKTKIGNEEWVTPFSMTAEEYSSYSLKQSMNNYFKLKNDEVLEKGTTKDEFALKDIKIPMGAAERIFGPGGVKIRPQGYVELSMGLKHSTNGSLTASQNRRSTTIFDVDQKINMSVDASIGDKMNFNLNYNTEANFDFDSKKLKLAYEGKEDEIIKYLEAGNVSLNTTNSLVSGATSLFGIRADLQFGKLRVNTVISQQESESTTAKSKGGIQTRNFEFRATDYEENRHFFLSNYFRDNYDRALAKLPFIDSQVQITDIEVWVTNKRGNFENARNIVAFTDLAEHDSISNKLKWSAQGTSPYPDNTANNLYSTVINIGGTYNQIRDINKVTEVMQSNSLTVGSDYEKLENARLLSRSEYSFDPKLGYISLDGYSLQSDEVLAVAYKYTVAGAPHRVGEFSGEISSGYKPGEQTGALMVKLLKPTSFSPVSPTWNLMMKNIYRIGAYNVQSDRFRLNVSYQSDTTGTYVNYLSEGEIKDQLLIKVMNLDRLNPRNNEVKIKGEDGKFVYGDGIFDFVEGYTIRAAKGSIIFPVVEPFGKHLAKKIGDPSIARKYIYEELYTMSITDAKQVAEKDKFKISGSYRASNSNEIDLGVTNVVRGSVRVTAGGVLLQEGSDYTVDYTSGLVTITNTEYSNSQISATVENQTYFNMQRKTLLGLNLSYDFNKDFTVGTTVMHMYEKPINTKMTLGSESVNNTLWGLNSSFRKESQWLTNLVDKLPFVEATAPSQIQLHGEFAKMFAGHYTGVGGEYSYLDDFESSRSRISLRDPYEWNLSSTPEKFPESLSSGKIEYGNNRALLSWYYIDNMFTRKNSSMVPQHIKSDKEQLSNHFVREIRVRELYPERDESYNETATIPVMNLSFYPKQRGPYNLDVTNINTEGELEKPKDRWGGMTRRLTNKDFESANIQYIEFWLMDPFVYNDTIPSESDKNKGGELYFNLGDISEDVLKDGYKFYENGITLESKENTQLYKKTVWGYVPLRQSTVYAFDNSDGNSALLRAQDVGYNGLSTDEELQFDTYKEYMDNFRARLNPDARERLDKDPFSPLNDPAGDNFHYFRGSDYDRDEVSILDRYKYINGTEGNTVGGVKNEKESYTTSLKRMPDVEDIDMDYTMNESNNYYQYKIELTPEKLAEEGNPLISNRREVTVDLPNGKSGKVTWYQFKIPLSDYEKPVVGNISNFRSIRYMRMFMTGFEKTTHLRFGTLDLVRGDWRTYTKSLSTNGEGTGSVDITSVNVEENSDRKPVNYVVPPGVSRILDPGQPQLRQENEQALSIKVTNLDSEKSRAIYKNTSYDLRRYKRLQMFVHAESIENEPELKKGNLSVFLRLGTDYLNNYYEYEIPLEITPPGNYSSNNYNDQLAVWPQNNMFDFPLELLKNVKVKRNREKRKAGSTITFTSPYPQPDPDKPNNKVTVVGNPSLSEINVVMIGVRNTTSNFSQSGEIWVNEMRLTDFDEEGGWAAKGSVNIALSDIGMFQFSGQKETVGFGSIDQSLMERRADDFYTYSISTSIDAGRFIPQKAKVSLPIYYTYTNETTTPKYDPLDQDVTLKESLSTVTTKAEKDSIKSLAQTKNTTKSFNITGAKINIRSKTPMPYDPANLTFGYSNVVTEMKDPTTVYDRQESTSKVFNYTYSPMQKTWSPFKNIKSKKGMSKFAKNLVFNYVPNNITINSNLHRIYNETVIRDLESYSLGADNSKAQMLSYSSEYRWDRDFSLTWDFTKNLKFSIQTGTNAEIEEPFLQVNKRQNPDDYAMWKDSVNASIRKFGRPNEYRQTASLTYNIPLNDIPFLDWINSSASYNSSYNWARGSSVESVDIGNTINNSMILSLNGRLNMLTLYNKWNFLKKVNQKFTQTSSSNRGGLTPSKPVKKTPRTVEKTIGLSMDSAVTVVHNLKTKNIQIIAKVLETNRTYKLKFKKVNDNAIKITTKDSVTLKLSIRQGPDAEENTWYKIAQYAARGVMSVRSITLTYSKRNENSIYGFKKDIGDFFGQSYNMVPGLGFAFGLEGDEDFLNKSVDRGWLITDGTNLTPARFNNATKFDITAQLEPVRGLKIDLKASRQKEDQTSLSIITGSDGINNPTRTLGGSFSMSISSLSTAFESSSSKNDYQSDAFDKMIAYRDILASRLQNDYDNTTTPANRKMVNSNSADVLVPAFLAAYTGKDVNKVSFSPFLALSSMVPAWTITYEGLTTLPWFKSKFKSFKLMHAYSSTYQIGNYGSFPTWQSINGDMGFITSVLDANQHIASSPYDINSVSINERFNPLFGAEGTMNNSMTLGLRYNKSRTLSLNITSYQIVEALSNELVLTMGYRINNFNRVIGLTSKNKSTFNNDLNIKTDVSYKKNQALLRKIEERYTQATSGTSATSIKISADYAMSKMLTIRAYFDRILNKPLVSSSAYPTTDTSFGLSIRFNLTQ